MRDGSKKKVWEIGLIKVDLKDGLVEGLKENFINYIYLIVK